MEANKEATSEPVPAQHFAATSNKMDTLCVTRHDLESTEYDAKKKDELSGVLCNGVQYYDLKGIPFISNNGLASLIMVLKSYLKQGIKLQFVNANKKIKDKIKEMGLDKLINVT